MIFTLYVVLLAFFLVSTLFGFAVFTVWNIKEIESVLWNSKRRRSGEDLRRMGRCCKVLNTFFVTFMEADRDVTS